MSFEQAKTVWMNGELLPWMRAAFIESNPQIKKPDEAENLLEREDGHLET